MRRILLLSLCLVLCGCDAGSRASSISGRGGVSTPRVPVASRVENIPINIGEVVKGRVTADDPPCVGEPQWVCQSFRLTAPSDGTFEVTLSYSDGNLNVSVTDAERSIWWWDPQPVFGSVRVRAQAKADAAYQIVVWEYEKPGVEFELRTSLRPN